MTLWLDEVEPTARVLEAKGYARERDETTATGGTGGTETRVRYRATDPERGSAVDLTTSDARSIARSGGGTIHHMALRARDGEEQQTWRNRLSDVGMQVTLVIDRQ